MSDLQPDCLTTRDVLILRSAISPRQFKRAVGYENERQQEHPSLTTKENSQGHVVCVAFCGKVGARNRCSIYDNRPKTCRDFKVGSLSCRAAREEAGLA